MLGLEVVQPFHVVGMASETPLLLDTSDGNFDISQNLIENTHSETPQLGGGLGLLQQPGSDDHTDEAGARSAVPHHSVEAPGDCSSNSAVVQSPSHEPDYKETGAPAAEHEVNNSHIVPPSPPQGSSSPAPTPQAVTEPGLLAVLASDNSSAQKLAAEHQASEHNHPSHQLQVLVAQPQLPATSQQLPGHERGSPSPSPGPASSPQPASALGPAKKRKAASPKSDSEGKGDKTDKPAKRRFTFKPVKATQRCGLCHTCLNPQLKKACETIRKQQEQEMQQQAGSESDSGDDSEPSTALASAGSQAKVAAKSATNVIALKPSTVTSGPPSSSGPASIPKQLKPRPVAATPPTVAAVSNSSASAQHPTASAPAAAVAQDVLTTELQQMLSRDGGVHDLKYVPRLQQLLETELRLGGRFTLMAVLQRSSTEVLQQLVAGTAMKTLETWVTEARDNNKFSAAATIVQGLLCLPVDYEVLKRNSIGQTIGKLRKHADAELKAAAEKVVEQWKKAVDASKDIPKEAVHAGGKKPRPEEAADGPNKKAKIKPTPVGPPADTSKPSLAKPVPKNPLTLQPLDDVDLLQNTAPSKPAAAGLQPQRQKVVALRLPAKPLGGPPSPGVTNTAADSAAAAEPMADVGDAVASTGTEQAEPVTNAAAGDGTAQTGASTDAAPPTPTAATAPGNAAETTDASASSAPSQPPANASGPTTASLGSILGTSTLPRLGTLSASLGTSSSTARLGSLRDGNSLGGPNITRLSSLASGATASGRVSVLSQSLSAVVGPQTAAARAALAAAREPSPEPGPRREKRKKVAWAEESKFVEFRFFKKDDPPAHAKADSFFTEEELAAQIAAKHARFESAARREHADERNALAHQHEVEEHEKHAELERWQKMVATSPWHSPPAIPMDPNWKVAQGEESTERGVHEEQIKHTPAAQYPSPEYIPPSAGEPDRVTSDAEVLGSACVIIPLNTPPQQAAAAALLQQQGLLPSTLPQTIAYPATMAPSQPPAALQMSGAPGVSQNISAILNSLAPFLGSGQTSAQLQPAAPLQLQLPPGQLPPGQLPPGQLVPGQLPAGQLPPAQMAPQYGNQRPPEQGMPPPHYAAPNPAGPGPGPHHIQGPPPGQHHVQPMPGPHGGHMGPTGPVRHARYEEPPGPHGGAPPHSGGRQWELGPPPQAHAQERPPPPPSSVSHVMRPSTASMHGPPAHNEPPHIRRDGPPPPGRNGPPSTPPLSKYCVYYNMPQGCRNGSSCRFIHEKYPSDAPAHEAGGQQFYGRGGPGRGGGAPAGGRGSGREGGWERDGWHDRDGGYPRRR